jgi:hypothetical protein
MRLHALTLLIPMLLATACSNGRFRLPASKFGQEPCTPTTPIHNDRTDVCIIGVDNLRPTHFAVGLRAAKEQAHVLRSMSKPQREAFLKKNPIPLVIGPDGEFYVVGPHLLARALSEAEILKTYGIVKDNWFEEDAIAFWYHMKDQNLIFLQDQHGNRREITELQRLKSLRDLKDDPFRTLAVKTACKIKNKCTPDQWIKQSVPFLEAKWANHFRKTPAIVRIIQAQGWSDHAKILNAAKAEVKRLGGRLP